MPKIASNFELGSAQPIDSRFVVETEAELANLKAYEGLEVYVKNTKLKMVYNGTEWVDYYVKAQSAETQEVSFVDTEEADYIDVGYSDTVDIESDEQVPTSKAVYKMIQEHITSIETLLEEI